MANEIQLTTKLTCINGYSRSKFDPDTIQITQSAIGAHSPIVSVGTSEEDMSFGDIGTVGYVCLRNTDTTNYVTYGPKSGGAMVAFGKIKAGETAIFRLDPTVTMRWQANTAACKVQVMALEN